jgi:hypothetical protein
MTCAICVEPLPVRCSGEAADTRSPGWSKTLDAAMSLPGAIGTGLIVQPPLRQATARACSIQRRKDRNDSTPCKPIAEPAERILDPASVEQQSNSRARDSTGSQPYSSRNSAASRQLAGRSVDLVVELTTAYLNPHVGFLRLRPATADNRVGK